MASDSGAAAMPHDYAPPEADDLTMNQQRAGEEPSRVESDSDPGVDSPMVSDIEKSWSPSWSLLGFCINIWFST